MGVERPLLTGAVQILCDGRWGGGKRYVVCMTMRMLLLLHCFRAVGWLDLCMWEVVVCMYAAFG
jgi:hypothetical protein